MLFYEFVTLFTLFPFLILSNFSLSLQNYGKISFFQPLLCCVPYKRYLTFRAMSVYFEIPYFRDSHTNKLFYVTMSFQFVGANAFKNLTEFQSLLKYVANLDVFSQTNKHFHNFFLFFLKFFWIIYKIYVFWHNWG